MRGGLWALLAAAWAAAASAGEPAAFRVDHLPTSLAGEWLFRAGHDPAWSSPFRERHAWQRLHVPGCWQRGAPGARGHAWYVTRLFVPSTLSDADLALDLGVVADAHEVFLNGRRIGTRGGLPPRPTGGVPSPTFYLLPKSALRYGDLNEVAIHLYSTAGCSGLLGPAPRVALHATLLATFVHRDMLLASLATLLLTLALVHLLLFATSSGDAAQLVLSLFLAVAAAFFLTQTRWGVPTLLGDDLTYRLHVAALLGAVATLPALLFHFLQAPLPVPLVSAQTALVLGIGFAVVWRPSTDLEVLVYVAQGALLLLGPYLLLKLWRHARLRRPLGGFTFAAATVLALTTAVDIATYIGMLPRRAGPLAGNTSFLGLLPFALAVTAAFFQRWARRRWGEAAAGGGVLSREKFLQRLEGEIERARRNGAPFSVALLRLTRPTEAAAREELAEQACAALRRALRQIDALAHLRWDTFAVLLADADERAAVLAVERLRHAALSALPVRERHPAMAAGVAQFRPGRPMSAPDFLAEAEAALFAATAEGPNATATAP